MKWTLEAQTDIQGPSFYSAINSATLGTPFNRFLISQMRNMNYIFASQTVVQTQFLFPIQWGPICAR